MTPQSNVAGPLGLRSQLLSIAAIELLQISATRTLEELQTAAIACGGLNTGRCQCGRTISKNKARCRACADKG